MKKEAGIQRLYHAYQLIVTLAACTCGKREQKHAMLTEVDPSRHLVLLLHQGSQCGRLPVPQVIWLLT